MDTLVLVQSTPEAQGDVPPRPNKYLFDEFAGFAGERRLRSILHKILPIALNRTWEIFEAEQVAGNDCYLGLVKASQAADRRQKTIRQDILAFEARKLLILRPEEKVLHQLDGTYRRRRILVKDFTGLYRLALEYYYWTQSDEYIEPDRDFADLIKADEHLYKKLRRFNNYRRILMTQVPGPRPQEREEDRWFSEYQADQTSAKGAEQAKGDTTDLIRPKYLPEQFPEQFPEHSADRIESNDLVESPKEDSNSTGSAETAKGRDLHGSSATYSHIERGAIRIDRNGTKESNEIEHRTSNSSVSSEEMAAGADAAKEVTVNNEGQSTIKEVAIVAPAAPLSGPAAEVSEARSLPIYIEGTHLAALSREWHDKAPRSSATRLAKLYFRMHAYGMDEYAFCQLLEGPATKTRKKLRYDHVSNAIGYFFTVLENDINAICKAWDEELHRLALENAQTSNPAGHISSQTLDLPSAVQGMASQEEAEALIERIQQEIGTISDMRLWDASIRACLEVYLVDLDLEYSPEASIVHRWSETFATPADWEAYYAEQMHGRVQS